MGEHERIEISPTIFESNGKTHRVWTMPGPSTLGCANITCRKEIEVPEGKDPLLPFLTFPSRKDPRIVDVYYFCDWHCMATWVRMNDDMARVDFASVPIAEDGTPNSH